jgi:hypothetical protein
MVYRYKRDRIISNVPQIMIFYSKKKAEIKKSC